MAKTVVYLARRSRRFSQALEDYAKLRDLGIRNCFLENQAALVAYEMPDGDEDFALAAIARAVEMLAHPVILANAILIGFASSGPTPTTAEHLRQLLDVNPQYNPNPVYSYSLAVAANDAAGHALIDATQAIRLLERAIEVATEMNWDNRLDELSVMHTKLVGSTD